MTKKLHNYLPYPLVSMTFLMSFTFYYFNAPSIFDFPDVPWHIAAGHFINTYGIPTTDPWSYTAGSTKWYNISWLWDLSLSKIVHATNNTNGLYNLSTALSAFTLALLCYTLKKRSTLKDSAICITLFLAMYTIWGSTNIRPQIITYTFAIIFHSSLHHLNPKLSTLKQLYLLPILMTLWVNIHGSFAIGFAIIGAYIIQSYIKKDWQQLKGLIIVSSFCALAMLINPYSWEIILATLRTLNSSITSHISEWHPLTLHTNLGPTLCVLTLLLVSNPRDKQIPLADKILTFTLLLAATWSIRYFTFFIILAAPYFAYNLGKTGNPPPFPDLKSKTLKTRCTIFTIVISLILLNPAIQHHIISTNKIDPKNKAPIAAIDYIIKNHKNKNILNDYNLGGYIIYYSNGQIKPFIDGRAGTAYPEELLKDYLTFLQLNDNWTNIINKYNIELIIINNNTSLNKILQISPLNDWEQAFKDHNASVYIKK